MSGFQDPAKPLVLAGQDESTILEDLFDVAVLCEPIVQCRPHTRIPDRLLALVRGIAEFNVAVELVLSQVPRCAPV